MNGGKKHELDVLGVAESLFPGKDTAQGTPGLSSFSNERWLPR